jgi:acetolactate synthase-1/3 small subunit
VEATGDEDKLESLTNLLRGFSIRELARTGRIAMSRGIQEKKKTPPEVENNPPLG